VIILITAKQSGLAIASKYLARVEFSPHHTMTNSAGQVLGGWDPKTGKIPTVLADEIEQAFSTVDHTLKHAGEKGWSQVYESTVYYTDDEIPHSWANSAKKWLPDHRPILTGIGVRSLAIPGMHLEIAVAAHVGAN
jgi:enamine deaminase RidA (YjgF/YER057c/UK114 family)